MKPSFFIGLDFYSISSCFSSDTRHLFKSGWTIERSGP